MAGPANRVFRLGVAHAELDDRALRRERTVEHDDRRLVGERPIERPDHLVSKTTTSARLSPTVRPVTVSAPRSSSGSSCFMSARAPPAASNASMVSAPFGRDRAQHGHLLAQLVEQREDVDVDAGLHGRRLQMLDAVDRSADRQHRRGGVAERARRQDVARLQVLPHHLDDAAARLAGEVEHLRAVGQHRRAPGSVMPSASQTMCIELAVPMPAHTPGPLIA